MSDNPEATKPTEKELIELMKKNKMSPVIIAWNTDNGLGQVFAGSFDLVQLTFLKELINRKIDSMVGQCMHFGVDMPKGPNLKLVESDEKTTQQ